jgi:ubiquinone/menaquinone biosynthesis C-methylase UbiE
MTQTEATLVVNPSHRSPDAAAFVGSIPEIYDAHLGPYLFEFSAEDIARRVAARVPEGGRVLEIACGTGIATAHLWRVLPKGTEIVATDLNPAMLDYARDRRGSLPDVSWRQADALTLPFADASFDVVVCQYGVMFFPDKDQGMAEMARVLKPGGSVVVNVWDSFAHNPAVEIAHEVIAEHCAGEPPAFLTVPFGDHDKPTWEARLRRVGLTDVGTHVVRQDVACADLHSFAKGLIEGNPGVTEIRARASVSTETISQRVAQRFAESFGDRDSSAPASIPMQEIVFAATKPTAAR